MTGRQRNERRNRALRLVRKINVRWNGMHFRWAVQASASWGTFPHQKLDRKSAARFQVAVRSVLEEMTRRKRDA